MILISAMTRDRVIGVGDGMPWSVPAEYEHYLELVRGQTVIMGRRSFEIFGADLTSAHAVAVSRSANEVAGAAVAGGINEALELARSYGTDVFCAGGASIYRLMMPLADAMYLSFIDGAYEGDTHFPDWEAADWVIERRERHPGFEFVVFRRSR